jgi:hypothetical protein
VQVARTASLFTSIRQIVTTVAGTYRAEFSVKIEGPTNKCYLSLTGQSERQYGLVATQDWVRYTDTFTTTGTNNYVRIVVSCDGTSQSGRVFFDNVTLTQVL